MRHSATTSTAIAADSSAFIAASAKSGRGAFLHGKALFLHQALQLARLEHLANDVAAADELALDVELRNGRPVGIGLDAVAQVVGLQDVQPFVRHADVVEDLNDLSGEPAL